MITIYIDNKPYKVEGEGKNLLAVCLSLGFDIPYFCWHPALHSVGACRLCAIKHFKDEHDKKGKIIMSCMTAATDGIRISIDDPEAVSFRARVIEWLMVNHPHDCPVCDEGGECHLQDMTVMTGHVYRRFQFPKRTYRNQDLGPYINHEMNRCIQCYRCVRFYRDYAGGRDFGVFSWHNHVYFGRHEDGKLESEFSGNLIEVCPTGVFTDKTLKKHYTRKWDLQTAPSVCVHCSLGCNTITGERYGVLRRIQARYNDKVNGYFLCDRGRFGYEFVNSDKRIRQPMIRNENGKLEPTTKTSASLQFITSILKGKIVGIGSPRASVESNYALLRLVGQENFYHGVSEMEFKLTRLIVNLLGTLRTPSMRETESADAVLIIGENVEQTAPMLALALRQASFQKPKQEAMKLKIAEWDDAALRQVIQDDRSPFFNTTQIDDEIIQALKNAKKPIIVTGTSCQSEKIIQAAANLASGLKCEIVFVVPECNSMGLAMMPGEQKLPEKIDTLIVMENELDYLDREILDKIPNIIVIDHSDNEIVQKAKVVLPAATFAEGDGTLVNNEGRAQRFYKVFTGRGTIHESWRWINELSGQHQTLDQITSEISEKIPAFKKLTEIAPPANFRMEGQKIPRQPHRYSGRTATTANISIHEPKPPVDPDTPLAFSMEGTPNEPPPSLIPRFWYPGWNSQQAINKFQIEVNGPLHGGQAGVRLIEPQEENK